MITESDSKGWSTSPLRTPLVRKPVTWQNSTVRLSLLLLLNIYALFTRYHNTNCRGVGSKMVSFEVSQKRTDPELVLVVGWSKA